jgi:putative ABC transport system ATP-binding protein
MSLLTLESVGKRYRDGQLERVVLRDVSLALDPGELIAVCSPEDSGRSTLLRIAAGIDRPDTGAVRFDGRDPAACDGSALGRGIGYCRQHRLSQGKGPRSGGKRSKGLRVLDDVMIVPLVVHGVRSAAAKTCARAALERVGVADCADLTVNELDRAEAVRVILAEALSLEPRLLLIYEPISDWMTPNAMGSCCSCARSRRTESRS